MGICFGKKKRREPVYQPDIENQTETAEKESYIPPKVVKKKDSNNSVDNNNKPKISVTAAKTESSPRKIQETSPRRSQGQERDSHSTQSKKSAPRGTQPSQQNIKGDKGLRKSIDSTDLPNTIPEDDTKKVTLDPPGASPKYNDADKFKRPDDSENRKSNKSNKSASRPPGGKSKAQPSPIKREVSGEPTSAPQSPKLPSPRPQALITNLTEEEIAAGLGIVTTTVLIKDEDSDEADEFLVCD